MKALAHLRSVAIQQAVAKTPHVPISAIAISRYSDVSANGLTKCIIDFLRMSGCQAERVSVEGRVIDTRKTYINVGGYRKTIGSVKRIKSSGQKGSADVSATIRGVSVKIEIKVGRDVQSKAQKEYQAQIEKSGGVYLIARNFQEFYDWFDSFKKG